MKLTRIKRLLICLIAMMYMLWCSNVSAEQHPSYEQPLAQSQEVNEQSLWQSQEVNERLSLYKRIRLEENKKVLMQLLHDIADIQKQCRDKGYLCSSEGLSPEGLSPEGLSPEGLSRAHPRAIDSLQYALPTHDTSLEYASPSMRAPNINLLGIVGGRARFSLDDGRIQDFSEDESIAGNWKVIEISVATATLSHDDKPDLRVLYQIHRTTQQNDNPVDIERNP
ncbi:MAG: hypothetical protein GDA45_00775 [Chromatiales bacterium]|nr:hypothetical protein [Chromatiales bacterium]